MVRIEAKATVQSGAPRAFLIACSEEADLERSLEELSELVRAAGAEVVGRLVQKERSPDNTLYLGRGKVEELRAAALFTRAQLIVADDELTPLQRRNLERALDIPVLDRTQVILDIFAQRARSSEGKLQVELAQLTYLLPRLTGWGQTLSRLGGGIGTRGPGETKLEVDRRRLKHRIAMLRRQIAALGRHRALQRRRREDLHLPVIALVGYTNSGKSTLLNALSGSQVSARNRPFETLDPTVRRVLLADGAQCLMTDTVGFIKKLPAHLVAAFRATLEEVVDADLLLHLVDASAPDVERQMEAVFETLEDIGAAGRPLVLAFNKIDQANPPELRRLLALHPDAVPISALYRTNLDRLRQVLVEALPERERVVELAIPYARASALSELYRWGRVIEQEYGADVIRVKAALGPAALGRLRALGLALPGRGGPKRAGRVPVRRAGWARAYFGERAAAEEHAGPPDDTSRLERDGAYEA
ncbi:MAG: GTPase HflX [Limnochordaceae bacterium]|nr:GTPase HflX [Limnochordaceae bacterium]